MDNRDDNLESVELLKKAGAGNERRRPMPARIILAMLVALSALTACAQILGGGL